MVAVFAIADGANGEYDAHIGIGRMQDIDGLLQVIGTFIYREFLLGKERLGALLAVIYYLACFIENINVIGAEGQECSLDGFQIGLSGEALDGMEDGGGIIHHAKGINDGAELLVGKACAYLIGKARPYEEHLLASPYPKPRVIYINYSPKLHYSLFTNHYSLTPADLQACGRKTHIYKAGIFTDAVFRKNLLDTCGGLGILSYHIQIAATTCTRQFVT